ncbi:MAG: hypothetical protein LBV34_06220 [Nocardiopsaceae bacterium]|jgi:hypothetical protein|nr:hypothetical protein [Nocardiopsaceae bacterium]
MNKFESFEALRRANPRRKPGFAEAVGATATVVRSRIETTAATDEPRGRRVRPRRPVLGISAAGVAVAAAAAVAISLTVGSGGGTANAATAIKKAATLSAESAQLSGTVNVRITHDGDLWASKVIQWNGDNLNITDNSPGGASSGSPLLVVNGIMYGHDPSHDGWVEVGPVSSIDSGSGTAPDDQLASIREDVGGATLQRIVAAMTGLTTTDQSDGSTVYGGTVAAGQIARVTGFKEGQTIRVFPFGYVAHDAAANPASPLDTAVTVGSDDVIREIAVTWGTWTYTVTYSDLGSTPPIVAPADAVPLRNVLRHTPAAVPTQ